MFRVSVEGFFTEGFPEVKMNYLAQFPGKAESLQRANLWQLFAEADGLSLQFGALPLPAPRVCLRKAMASCDFQKVSPGPLKEGFPAVKMNYLVFGQDVRFRIIESDD